MGWRARDRRWLVATTLAVFGVLAISLGAGRLVGLSLAPTTSHAPHPSASAAAFPTDAARARFTGTLPALPSGPVPVVLSAFALPVGARLMLPAGPGPVLLSVEVGAVRARVGGSTALLGATPEAVAPPFQVAQVGDTAGQGSGLVAPAGAAIELANVGSAPATGTLVAFGTMTDVASDDAAVHRIAGGQLDPPPAGPLRAEVTRWSLAPGAIMPAHVVAYPELLATAAGTVAVALHPGEAVIRRGYGGEERVSGEPGDPLESRPGEDEGHEHEGESADSAQPAGPPMLRGSVLALAAGDAAGLRPGSTRTLQGIGPAEAVVWVVALVPAGAASGTPSP